MNSKKSKVNKIKLCLKKGIPVAVIAAGVVAAANGCEDNSSKQPVSQPVSQPKPTSVSFEDCHNVVLNVVATLKLDNSHFSKDLTKLSEAGNKKLNDFTMQLAEIGKTIPWYYITYKIDIDFSEKNAKRKRKKAQAVFDKYSFHLYSTGGTVGMPGQPAPPYERIEEEIASILRQKFNLKPMRFSTEEWLDSI